MVLTCSTLVSVSYRQVTALKRPAPVQMRRVDGVMAALANWAGTKEFIVDNRFGLVDIATGTVCHYLDVRFPDYDWRGAHLFFYDCGNSFL